MCPDSRLKISIHALRGEGDLHSRSIFKKGSYFNPRPPWGGRRLHPTQKPVALFISIHALRGEGDGALLQSVLSGSISIHALRGEGDHALTMMFDESKNFNPRPPWGGRRKIDCVGDGWDGFQSTPSVGRATHITRFLSATSRISIHALRGEGDGKVQAKERYFYISIHALRGEGDSKKQSSTF